MKDGIAKSVAIITGDLVGSSQAGPDVLDRAMAALEASARVVAGWTPGGEARFTRYRGDGWQTHVARPALALRGAVFLFARLRAADLGLATRAAIGVGEVGSLGTRSLADARGPAFEASGHALDDMGRLRRLTIEGEGITDLHRIVVDLLDERIGRWTRNQAEAVALYLLPGNPTLHDLAPELGITAQAVNYRLTGAGAPAIRRSLATWEEDWERAGDA